ncbi:helix-turn-helix domain-containing protein [Halobacteriales archaeon Cl-PHB]
MSIIAEFRVRSPDFFLWDTQQACPDLHLHIVQEAGTDPERPHLWFWVEGVDSAAFETATAADPTVSDVTRLSTDGDRVLYKGRITEATEVVNYSTWVELGASQLESYWADGWWHNRYRVPDREALGAIGSWCREQDIEFELTAVYDETPADRSETVLSQPQRETLQVAIDLGYFAVPRSVSLAEVAEELGISSQAVSERLRRAHQRLVEHHLT